MSDATELVTCSACGQKNRIQRNASSGTFRCGACQAPLITPPSAVSEFFLRTLRGVVAIIVFAIPVYAVFSAITNPNHPSSQAAAPTPRPYIATSYPLQPPSPTPTPFLEPELLLPDNGETVTYKEGRVKAPFEIKSSYGTNYLVKLSDAFTDRPVLTVFVQGGNTVEINVPLGTYKVKYAAGSRWYGYTHLFGPQTAYSKARDFFTFERQGDQVNGFSITLYKVQNGNLHTEHINPEDF